MRLLQLQQVVYCYNQWTCFNFGEAFVVEATWLGIKLRHIVGSCKALKTIRILKYCHGKAVEHLVDLWQFCCDLNKVSLMEEWVFQPTWGSNSSLYEVVVSLHCHWSDLWQEYDHRGSYSIAFLQYWYGVCDKRLGAFIWPGLKIK